MSYWSLDNLILQMNNLGLLTVLLPFLLVFTLVYAVLQKSKILGKDKEGKPRKNFNVMIALILGISFVAPSVTGNYPPHLDPVKIVNQALPGVAILLVAVLMVLLLIGMFNKDFDLSKGFGGFVAFASIGAVIVIFGIASEWFGTQGRYIQSLRFLYDPQFQALIVMLLVFGLLIYFITADEKKNTSDDKWYKILKDRDD